jgi:hypothetical protein
MTTLDKTTEPRAASTPIPKGRGRWRLVAYRRQFSNALPVVVAQLDTARGRRLDQKWNSPAELTFTLDGHSPSAALLTELATDVVAFRWHEPTGRDVPVFRGLIDHSEDQLSEQSAVVTFTAHDYFAMLTRRTLRGSANYVITQTDQDQIVYNLMASAVPSAFSPGSFLPLATVIRNPDGSSRMGYSGQLRDRTYVPGAVIGNAIDDLAKVQGGFDYDVAPGGPSNSWDSLRIFYPQQGITRTDTMLMYGANVSSLTRTVSSTDYANLVRVIGNKGSADPNAAQLYSEQWNTDSNNITITPVGLWMAVENASDVSVQTTLDEKANGDLAIQAVLSPSYTVKLRAGAYTYGMVNMGDVVPLVIQEGRLNVNTSVRVVGISYDIGDDGQEDVELTVGRPPATLAKLLTGAARNIDQLARR